MKHVSLLSLETFSLKKPEYDKFYLLKVVELVRQETAKKMNSKECLNINKVLNK